MKNTFWMFSVMLMLITLISSMGGGIRFRENFVQEVLDLNDNTSDPPMGYDYYPIQYPVKDSSITKSVTFNEKIEEDKQAYVVEEEEEDNDIVSKPVYNKITDPMSVVAPIVPIDIAAPKAVPSNHKSTPQSIVPYGGEFYAPF